MTEPERTQSECAVCGKPAPDDGYAWGALCYGKNGNLVPHQFGREPERTPQTAPDLEALREAVRDAFSDPQATNEAVLDDVMDIIAEHEARVRAEDEHILRIAHVNTTATLEANATLRAERDAARAEVERLRVVIEREVEGQHQQSCEAYWVGKAECYCHVGRLLAALSTEAAQ